MRTLRSIWITTPSSSRILWCWILHTAICPSYYYIDKFHFRCEGTMDVILDMLFFSFSWFFLELFSFLFFWGLIQRNVAAAQSLCWITLNQGTLRSWWPSNQGMSIVPHAYLNWSLTLRLSFRTGTCTKIHVIFITLVQAYEYFHIGPISFLIWSQESKT